MNCLHRDSFGGLERLEIIFPKTLIGQCLIQQGGRLIQRLVREPETFPNGWRWKSGSAHPGGFAPPPPDSCARRA